MNETENRIDGLEVGADDYIAKPFEPRELILRIQRILDRQEQQTATGLVRFGTFTFDCDSRVLSEGGQRIHITTAEQDLLSCFAVAPNQILSREEYIPATKRPHEGSFYRCCGCAVAHQARGRSALSCLSANYQRQGLVTAHKLVFCLLFKGLLF